MTPYDLESPAQILVPPYAPWREAWVRGQSRPSVCGSDPAPEGFVRLVLADDYYLGAQWRVLGPKEHADATEVFDVPAGQYERWETAAVAYGAVQSEVLDLIDGRTARA